MALDIYSITFQSPFMRFFVGTIALFTGLLIWTILSNSFLKNGSRRYIGIIGVILFFGMVEFFAGISLVEPFFGGIIQSTTKGVEELLVIGTQLRVRTLVVGALMSAIVLAFLTTEKDETIKEDERKKYLSMLLTVITVLAVGLYAFSYLIGSRFFNILPEKDVLSALQVGSFIVVFFLSVTVFNLRKNFVKEKDSFSSWFSIVFALFALSALSFLFSKDIWDLFSWLSVLFRLMANITIVYALLTELLEK